MAVNRYVGEYPVIGIRPTIDGRRGVLKVRESLEEQTDGESCSFTHPPETGRDFPALPYGRIAGKT